MEQVFCAASDIELNILCLTEEWLNDNVDGTELFESSTEFSEVLATETAGLTRRGTLNTVGSNVKVT